MKVKKFMFHSKYSVSNLFFSLLFIGTFFLLSCNPSGGDDTIDPDDPMDSTDTDPVDSTDTDPIDTVDVNLSDDFHFTSDTLSFDNFPTDTSNYPGASLISSFKLEGLNRGVLVDTTQILIVYDSAMEYGNCVKNRIYMGADTIKLISINPFFHCWDNTQMLEVLIFHQFGHLL
jgi:hypothetical protein